MQVVSPSRRADVLNTEMEKPFDITIDASKIDLFEALLQCGDTWVASVTSLPATKLHSVVIRGGEFDGRRVGGAFHYRADAVEDCERRNANLDASDNYRYVVEEG